MLSLHTVVVDTADPRAAAGFWAAVLEVPVCHDWGEYVRIGSDPPMAFQFVAEPTRGKNRLHLDLGICDEEDLDAQIQRLIALGATRVSSIVMRGASWIVMTDPDGNEFCLISKFVPEAI